MKCQEKVFGPSKSSPNNFSLSRSLQVVTSSYPSTNHTGVIFFVAYITLLTTLLLQLLSSLLAIVSFGVKLKYKHNISSTAMQVPCHSPQQHPLKHPGTFWVKFPHHSLSASFFLPRLSFWRRELGKCDIYTNYLLMLCLVAKVVRYLLLGVHALVLVTTTALMFAFFVIQSQLKYSSFYFMSQSFISFSIRRFIIF